MPTDALKNPLVLPMLGLLVESPLRGYAVFSELRSRYSYLRVRNASVYTLLDRLTVAGWVASAGGALLHITSAGREALTAKVEAQLQWAALSDVQSVATALAYLGILTPQRARDLLTERSAALRAEADRIAAERGATDVSELHMIELDYLTNVLRCQANWLTRTVDRISTGELAWLPN